MFKAFFKKIRLSDFFFVGIGAFIGYNLDLVSVVCGSSMEPTLIPDQKVFFVPFWLFSPFRSLRLGDVVLVNVTESMVVCKRICRLTSDPHVRDLWNEEANKSHLSENSNVDVFNIETDFFRVHKMPGYAEPEDFVEETQSGEVEFACCTRVSNQSAEQNKTYLCDETGAAPNLGRSTDWNWCQEKPTQEWMWIEGDNHQHSFDSRMTGAVSVSCTKGLVLLRWKHPFNIKFL